MSGKVKDKKENLEENKAEENNENGSKKKDLEEKLAKKEERIDQLEEKLAEQEEELKNYIERIKRIQADFENYKKRVRREQKEKREKVEDRFLLNIIPIYDNLERAFRNFEHNNDKDSFIEGVEKIFSQFDSFLEDEGVEPIESEGERFDPKKHQALMTVESNVEPNTVVEEFERGYMRNSQVLKPSRVKVSKRKPSEKDKSKGEKMRRDE